MVSDKQIPVWEAGEYTYPMACGFEPNLMPYLHEDGADRPCLIVCPGGGYAVASPTEGELVAKKFYEKGYNCFVFTYTTNMLMAVPLLDQPMRDLARAVRFVRRNHHRFGIDPARVYICGFSAAGHLCASLCDYFAELTEENPKYADISCRPDGAILSYPVINSGEYAHQDSFRALAGRDIYERTDEEAAALLDRYSLEKHVSADTPPCFIWQTATDELVPVENSYLYANALKEKGVLFAHHVFSHGQHGLSLADEDWAAGRFGEPYTLEQMNKTMEAIQSGALQLPPEVMAALSAAGGDNPLEQEWNAVPVPEATVWPDLANAFLVYVEETKHQAEGH
jgi:acetyl esterase/lipase